MSSLDDSDPPAHEAVDAAGIGVWDFRPQTGALVWSLRCKQLFGLSPEASVDYGVFLRGVHIDDRARVSQAVQRALTPGGEPGVDLEYRTLGPDGTLRWLWALGLAHFDASTGAPERLVGTVVDITERKQRALQDRQLSQVAESSADFIAYASPDGKALYLNPAGLALVGLDDLAEVQGHEMIDFFTPEDQQRLRTQLLPVVQQQGRWIGEFRFRHFRTGSTVPVHYNLFRVDDPATGALAGYATVAIDMSRRKRGEGDNRFFLADSVPQLLSTLNPRGDITYVNRRARDFTGRTHEELCLCWHELIHPEDSERVAAAWTAAQASGRGYQIEHRLRRRDGEYRWLRVDAVSQHDADGRVLQWVRSSTDIHELREAQEDLQARDSELGWHNIELTRQLEAATLRIAELEAKLSG